MYEPFIFASLDSSETATYKASNNAVQFKVRFPTGRGIFCMDLSAKNNIDKDLYKIVLSESSSFLDVSKRIAVFKEFHLPDPIGAEYSRFWLSWYNNEIKLGVQGRKRPILKYGNKSIRRKGIGYIKFCIGSAADEIHPVDWIFEALSPNIREISPNHFEDGQLCWRSIVDGRLPSEAIIGGFEDEPIYIARAEHNGSMWPGKYVPSKRLAFFTYGLSCLSETIIEKDNFEILCGYNARWVRCTRNAIPDNAFIGGYDKKPYGENNEYYHLEPLYIGRAMIDNNLVCGKVVVPDKGCYIAKFIEGNSGKDVKVNKYEILITPYVFSKGVTMVSLCD